MLTETGFLVSPQFKKMAKKGAGASYLRIDCEQFLLFSKFCSASQNKAEKKIDGSVLLAKKFSQVCQPALELSTKCFVLQKYLKGVSL